MGPINTRFLVSNSEYRICVVGDKKALFHRWNEFCKVVEASPFQGGAPAGQIKYTLGMVEYEDGRIEEVAPHKIKFMDNAVKREWSENASSES